MARPLRIQRAGCWYHLTARGNERREIFLDDKDRRHFLELLEEMSAMFALRLHAFVLMAKHYPLLLETTEANLSRALQWLNTSSFVYRECQGSVMAGYGCGAPSGGSGADVAELGRKICGLSFRQLCDRVQIAYSSAAGAVWRFAERVEKDAAMARVLQQAMNQIENE